MTQCHATILGGPLKECVVTPDLASKPLVSSSSAALPLLRESLESGQGPAVAGVAFLMVFQVHAQCSMGKIVLLGLIRMTEGQMYVISWYYKRCISSLGTGVTPLENTYNLYLKAYSVRELAMLTDSVFWEISTCHVLKTPYVSESPGAVLRITGQVLDSMHLNSAMSIFGCVYICEVKRIL